MNKSPPAYGTSQPPAYTQSNSENVPPPSYESIFGRVKEARLQSANNVDYAKKFFQIVVSTIGFTLLIAIFLAIPITMIVIGSLYIHDCKAEKFIPIYLIVFGVFGAVRNVSSLFQRCKNRNETDAEERNASTNPFDSLISCFLLGWFIAGNVWIYRIYDTVDLENTTSGNYCQPVLYYFAFWITTAVYILAICGCCSLCLLGIFGAICGTNNETNEGNTPIDTNQP